MGREMRPKEKGLGEECALALGSEGWRAVEEGGRTMRVPEYEPVRARPADEHATGLRFESASAELE